MSTGVMLAIRLDTDLLSSLHLFTDMACSPVAFLFEMGAEEHPACSFLASQPWLLVAELSEPVKEDLVNLRPPWR